jgi:hypothetical protein
VFSLPNPRQWLRARPPEPETSTPFDVPCSCGRSLRGRRQNRGHVVTCPGCARKRLILPNSPWPVRDALTTAASSRTTPPLASPVRLGRLVLIVVVGGLAAMGLTFWAVKDHLRRPPPLDVETPTTAIHQRIEAGQRALREGAFRLALKELNAAVEERDRNPNALNRDEHRQLDQLRRQADSLAHLLNDSLEEILQKAMQQHNDDEWREKFEDYRGRSVLFDDELRRDAAGNPTLAFYVVRVGKVEARVALEDLPLLRQLAMDGPRRRLFGARLADCKREEGGRWVFRFDPDSAVLLTDEGAAASSCPGPMDDDLREVLQRQDEWLRR